MICYCPTPTINAHAPQTQKDVSTHCERKQRADVRRAWFTGIYATELMSDASNGLERYLESAPRISHVCRFSCRFWSKVLSGDDSKCTRHAKHVVDRAKQVLITVCRLSLVTSTTTPISMEHETAIMAGLANNTP